MADQDDVRRIALTLPGAVEEEGHFAFGVEVRGKLKAFAWVWLERIDPKKARVPRADRLAVRVANAEAKDFLLTADPGVFFTEPHYNGFPAVLVRLEAIDFERLETLLIDAWSCHAPKALRAEFGTRGGQPPPPG